ncbi:hypothetical protein BH686_16810 [Rhodococcus erythropolis]|uniref:hypothetical protein n=1 Tax=Rhodococcus erythropolis TaxID=1833 RepID=UPI000A0BCE14|nr:hypothetical protein [Rhodococcus erythropolis]ORI22058.1 hypothetical protein BH686_16810 [Rhodococcus erythropolis]
MSVLNSMAHHGFTQYEMLEICFYGAEFEISKVRHDNKDRLIRDWEKAAGFIASRPSAIDRAQVLAQLEMIQSHLDHSRWQGGSVARALLQLLLDHGRRLGLFTLQLNSMTFISAELNVSLGAVSKAVRTLESKGFITTTRSTRKKTRDGKKRAQATTYRLHLPARDLPDPSANNGRPRTSVEINAHDAFARVFKDGRQLGVPPSTATVYQAIASAGIGTTVREIVDIERGIARSTVYRALRTLTDLGLCEKSGLGRWIITDINHSERLHQIAVELNTAGTAAERFDRAVAARDLRHRSQYNYAVAAKSIRRIASEHAASIAHPWQRATTEFANSAYRENPGISDKELVRLVEDHSENLWQIEQIFTSHFFDSDQGWKYKQAAKASKLLIEGRSDDEILKYFIDRSPTSTMTKADKKSDELPSPAEKAIRSQNQRRKDLVDLKKQEFSPKTRPDGYRIFPRSCDEIEVLYDYLKDHVKDSQDRENPMPIVLDFEYGDFKDIDDEHTVSFFDVDHNYVETLAKKERIAIFGITWGSDENERRGREIFHRTPENQIEEKSHFQRQS